MAYNFDLPIINEPPRQILSSTHRNYLMHRIPALLASSNETASVDKSSATMVSSYSDMSYRTPAEVARRLADELYLDTEFPHRLFLPHNFTPSYDYPLVVWLHSDRSSEMELDSVMESLSDQNYIAVAPRANIRSSTKQRLFQWGNSKTDVAFAEEAVCDCIASAKELLPVKTDRVFLAGFGTGGTMAQWIGLQYSNLVAGVVSLSGAMPSLGGSLSNWKTTRHLPVLFSHRRGSSLCSHSDLQNAMRFSHRAGLNYRFSTLWSEEDTFSEADELSSSMLAVANRFMMGIVTNSDISLEPEFNRDHLVGPFGVN
jgi:phospholipase/carboxylesterase